MKTTTMERLKAWRAGEKLSLRASAILLGLSASHLGRIERGGPVGVDAAKRLSRELGADWAELVTWKEDNHAD